MTDAIPEKLRTLLDMIATQDRTDRIQTLIDLGRNFQPVPESVASKPYPEAARVPHCESEAFFFPEPQPDGTLKLHFAVENPQGISAMATAVILDRTLSGAPLEQVATVPADVVYEIFGRELSMGKNMGLTGMVNMVKAAAQRRLQGNPE